MPSDAPWALPRLLLSGGREKFATEGGGQGLCAGCLWALQFVSPRATGFSSAQSVLVWWFNQILLKNSNSWCIHPV